MSLSSWPDGGSLVGQLLQGSAGRKAAGAEPPAASSGRVKLQAVLHQERAPPLFHLSPDRHFPRLSVVAHKVKSKPHDSAFISCSCNCSHASFRWFRNGPYPLVFWALVKDQPAWHTAHPQDPTTASPPNPVSSQ